jgi:dihydrofolate reductase
MVNLIVATAKNNVIGKDGKMLWDLPGEMRYFKEKTEGNVVIMGRKTYESIGSRPLPNRKNIVLTRQDTLIDNVGVYTETETEDSLYFAYSCLDYNPNMDIFVIGGQTIYEQMLPYADTVYQTCVGLEIEGDAYFPKLNPIIWKQQNSHVAMYTSRDEKQCVLCIHKIFVRRFPRLFGPASI